MPDSRIFRTVPFLTNNDLESLESYVNFQTDQTSPLDYFTNPQRNAAFSLEIATCGMQKNTALPVPYENFSLDHGSFGDDAGFTIQKADEIFLGNQV